MYENITRDGVYSIGLSRSNPYARYLLVKTYGGEQKKKRMCSLEDCRQQVREWDEDYSGTGCQFDRGFKVLLSPRKEKSREAKNYYSVYDLKGNLYMQGYGSDIAEKLGCKPKTVCNAANTKDRKLVSRMEGFRALYNVVKAQRPPVTVS